MSSGSPKRNFLWLLPGASGFLVSVSLCMACAAIVLTAAGAFMFWRERDHPTQIQLSTDAVSPYLCALQFEFPDNSLPPSPTPEPADTSEIENLLDEAERDLAAGKPQQVLDLLTPALSRFNKPGDSARAHQDLGQAECRLGRFQLAAAYFEKAYAYQPTPRRLLHLAATYELSGDYQKALDIYTQLSQGEDSDAEPYRRFAQQRVQDIEAVFGTPTPAGIFLSATVIPAAKTFSVGDTLDFTVTLQTGAAGLRSDQDISFGWEGIASFADVQVTPPEGHGFICQSALCYQGTLPPNSQATFRVTFQVLDAYCKHEGDQVKLNVYLIQSSGGANTFLPLGQGAVACAEVTAPTPANTPTAPTLPPATPPPISAPACLSATPSVSDPRQIAFSSSRDGNNEIYVMNADGANQTNLTRHPGRDEKPSWSPDGKCLLFSSNRDANNKSDIYAMNADSSDPTNLTRSPAYEQTPIWSPDGTRIVFLSDRDGNSEIYLINADGSGLSNLTRNPGSDQGPVWSPDSKWIAFISDRDAAYDIYLLNVADALEGNRTEPLRLTNSPNVELELAWSPDGARIAFSGNVGMAGFNFEIFVLEVADALQGKGSAKLVRLTTTDDGKNEVNPRWAPDGRRLAFASDQDGDRDIYILNADSSEQTLLTNNFSDDGEPVWSPDGEWIAFTSTRDGDAEIFLMKADGSQQQQLTFNAANDFSPVWRP